MVLWVCCSVQSSNCLQTETKPSLSELFSRLLMLWCREVGPSTEAGKRPFLTPRKIFFLGTESTRTLKMGELRLWSGGRRNKAKVHATTGEGNPSILILQLLMLSFLSETESRENGKEQGGVVWSLLPSRWSQGRPLTSSFRWSQGRLLYGPLVCCSARSVFLVSRRLTNKIDNVMFGTRVSWCLADDWAVGGTILTYLSHDHWKQWAAGLVHVFSVGRTIWYLIGKFCVV